MKVRTIYHPTIGLFIIFFFVFCCVLSPQKIFARDSGAVESFENYSPEELSQMLAPIALYPDALLSQVLMASTYPIEVIEADRWIRKNQGVKGDALDRVLRDKDWDPSIKAICHFPSILALMSERITETTHLGNAFLAQEAEVMDIVQELRTRAYETGSLVTGTRLKVIVDNETILIVSADSRIIHVPYYDPYYVYGRWLYPAYPPYYWGPARAGVGISYWPGFYFGFSFGTWTYFDWHHHHVYINAHNRPGFVRKNRWKARHGRWHHAPRHRRGVAYKNKVTAEKYRRHPNHVRNFRHDNRGFSEPRGKKRFQRNDGRTGITHKFKERQRVNRYPQAHARIRQDRQKPGRENRSSQMRQYAGQNRQKQERAEHRRQPRTSDKAFNRSEDGREGRHSFKYGRSGRQYQNNDSRGSDFWRRYHGRKFKRSENDR